MARIPWDPEERERILKRHMARKTELDLVSTLEAVGLHVETDCPVHPDADHAPFECPPGRKGD